MKYGRLTGADVRFIVTPFAGVWIEIGITWLVVNPGKVTPFAGVWIEIVLNQCCGGPGLVTPFAGVWIEITA